MSGRSLQAILLFITLPFAAAPVAGLAQQPLPADEPGIWLADATGNLRRVEPASTTFLRQDGPATQARAVFVVETFAESANGALAAGKLAVERITRAVSGWTGAAQPVSSELAYVEPRYQRRILLARWEQPRRLGFDAGYYVTVPVRDATQLGLLIDLATGAGATGVLDVRAGTP